MSNKAAFIVGFALMCVAVLSFGQRNFVPGVIVRLEGDSIKGFIDYRNWRANPKFVGFKKSVNEERIDYNALTIKSFIANQEVYEGAIITVEESLSTVNELKYRIDTVFLQAMFLGSKNLYFYEDYHGKEQFYIKQDGKFTLLLYKEFQDMQGGVGSIKQNKQYLGQLVQYLNACKSIQTRLNKTKYTKKDLIALFNIYHECIGEKTSLKKTKDRIITKWGLIGGYTATKIDFSEDFGSQYKFMTDVQYPVSNSFSAGTFFDLLSPRNQNKWSSYNEILFTSFKTNNFYNDYKDSDQYTISSTDLNFSHLKLNNMIRYTYPIKRMGLFFNIGITNGMMIKSSTSHDSETKFYSTTTKLYTKDFFQTRKHEPGFLLGFGVRFGNASFEYRFERTSGVSGQRSLGASVIRNYIMTAYRF